MLCSFYLENLRASSLVTAPGSIRGARGTVGLRCPLRRTRRDTSATPVPCPRATHRAHSHSDATRSPKGSKPPRAVAMQVETRNTTPVARGALKGRLAEKLEEVRVCGADAHGEPVAAYRELKLARAQPVDAATLLLEG